MTARKDAMARLDEAVSRFASDWATAAISTDADHDRSWRRYRRALRALLRERATLAMNEVDGARASGPWHEQANAMIGRIEAAVLGRKR